MIGLPRIQFCLLTEIAILVSCCSATLSFADENSLISVFTGEQSSLCSTVKYIDRFGESRYGTKNCLTSSVSECLSDGVTGCTATTNYPAIEVSKLSATNIKTGVAIGGVSGTFSPVSDLPNAWDLRAGVTVGSVTGKLLVNCRNAANSSFFNYDGTVSFNSLQ